MLVKLMSLLDLYAALSIILMQYDVIGWRLGFGAAAWLFFKGYAYKGDFASFLDILCGFYVLFMIFGLSNALISWLAVIYLGQKIAASFL